MNLLNRIRSKKVDNSDISKCFQRCFANADGEKILNYLSQLTLERVMASTASGDELRHLEGQRYIVQFIFNHSITNK